MLTGLSQPPVALVTGIAGQDGAYLAHLLLSKGYAVHGTARISSSLWRLEAMGIHDRVSLICDPKGTFDQVVDLVKRVQPAELYHLAANSSVSESIKAPLVSGECDALMTLWLLEAVRLYSPDTRIFFASSAEMFQPGDGISQDEHATLGPQSPYACAKIFGYHLCQTYRLTYGTFACSGILFNHESPLRSDNFVTRKITKGLGRLKVESDSPTLQLGNLDSRRDWGFAGEFVDAMWRMLQAQRAEDFVLATGHTHSVRDFCEFAAAVAGFELMWKVEGERELGVDRSSQQVLIESAVTRFRANDARCRIGNPNKAAGLLNWRPTIFTPQLAEMMMQDELARIGAATL